MDVDGARQKNDGENRWQCAKRNMRPRDKMGVSRAPDDRLAFKAASGCYDRIFCGTGPGVAGLLACLLVQPKAWGKA
jgi:hypothetical protein